VINLRLQKVMVLLSFRNATLLEEMQAHSLISSTAQVGLVSLLQSLGLSQVHIKWPMNQWETYASSIRPYTSSVLFMCKGNQRQPYVLESETPNQCLEAVLHQMPCHDSCNPYICTQLLRGAQVQVIKQQCSSQPHFPI
jgi:hypothetical protein